MPQRTNIVFPDNIFHSELIVRLLNSTPDGIVIVGATGTIVFVNIPAEIMFGYESNELIGESLDLLLPQRFRPQHISHLKHFFSNPVSRPMAGTERELFGIRKDGTEFPIDVSLGYIDTSEGTLAISNIRDISERIKAEAESKHSQRILSESQMIAKIGSWELDLLNNELTWSDEVFRIFEIDKNKFGASYEAFLDCVHPDDRYIVHKAYVDSVEKKLSYNIVHRLSLGNDCIKYVREIGKTFYSESGEPLRSIGTVHDITEVRSAHLELNRRLNDMMQFNYIVSHNLRSPVASILGLAELLNRPDNSPSEVKDITEHILSAAQRLDETIKDINTILDTQTSVNEHKALLSLDELLAKIFDSLQVQIDQAKCTFKLDIPEDSNEIYTVKSYLESILYNLINNALKYRSEKRDLIIDIAAVKAGKTLRLSLSDNGIGIDMSKHKDDIFSLYKRFSNHIEGKGLGLYMTKMQVEILGGKIEVESTPDVGTTFTIVFGSMFDR